jgi:Flp pilus assembly protein TadB
MNSHSWLLSLPAGLAAIFAALFIAALTAMGSLSRASRQRDLADRIVHYGPQRALTRAAGNTAGKPRLNRVALDVTNGLMTGTAQRRLAERLDLAAVGRKPAEWILLGCCLGVVIAAALSLATGYVAVGILGGALLAWLVMRMSLSYMIRRRRAAFSDQLPDLLQLIASALQSGFSLLQAVDAVVRENSQPAAGEFSRALTEAKLGADLDDCLDAIADRMDSDDLRWTVMAVRIQRGIGGNLAEILTTIVGTIRERGFLRRQVRALSAEGRLSAYILVALPVLVGAWLFTTDRPYMRLLYTTRLGLLMLIGAVVLLVVGGLWMRKTIQLEV